MKKILLALALFTAGLSQAQTKKAVTTKKTTTHLTMPVTKSTVLLKTPLDSFSYAVGLEGAAYYKNQGAPQLNTEIVKKAFEDVYNAKTFLLTPEQSSMTIQKQLQAFMAGKSEKVKEEGRKFLAENKKRPGVVELPNGLQYEILKAGTGPKPKATDTVRAHYIGSLINGQEFDNSYKRGQPLQIPVGGVIQGWIQALQMMPVGSKWKLFIPSNLGYGDNGAGNGAIPGGATLIFEIELIEIVNK